MSELHAATKIVERHRMNLYSWLSELACWLFAGEVGVSLLKKGSRSLTGISR